MKQILRIRWRWFGHPAAPPPHTPPLGDYFSGRRASGGSGDGASGGGGSGVGGPGGLVASGSAGANLCGGGRKFGDPAGSRSGPGEAAAGDTGNSCPRSLSQPECGSSAAALSWVSPPPLRRSRPGAGVEPSGEVPAPQPGPAPAGSDEEAAPAAAAAPAAGAEENHPETDSSSCR